MPLRPHITAPDPGEAITSKFLKDLTREVLASSGTHGPYGILTAAGFLQKQTLATVRPDWNNNGAGSCPAFGCFKLSTGGRLGPANLPYFKGSKPSAYGSQYSHYFNEARAADEGGWGKFQPGPIFEAAYDSNDGTPAVGEFWGPQSGTYLLKKNTGGFMVIDLPNLTRLTVKVARAPMEKVRGQVGSTVAAGGTGDLTVYTGAFGSESSTSQTISSVKNDSECSVVTGKMTTAIWVPDNDSWEFAVWHNA